MLPQFSINIRRTRILCQRCRALFLTKDSVAHLSNEPVPLCHFSMLAADCALCSLVAKGLIDSSLNHGVKLDSASENGEIRIILMFQDEEFDVDDLLDDGASTGDAIGFHNAIPSAIHIWLNDEAGNLKEGTGLRWKSAPSTRGPLISKYKGCI
jgi:hypothetical protein